MTGTITITLESPSLHNIIDDIIEFKEKTKYYISLKEINNSYNSQLEIAISYDIIMDYLTLLSLKYTWRIVNIRREWDIPQNYWELPWHD